MTNREAGAFVVVGVLILFLGTFTVLAIDAYSFAATGTWHWYAVADYASYLGADPVALQSAISWDQWPGAAKVANWLLFQCPMEWWTVGLGALLTAVGAGNE